MTLETQAPRRKYKVNLLGYNTGRSLMVSAPSKDGLESLLKVGADVAIRLLAGKRACAFESTILYRSIQPYSYYHLAYPEDVEAVNVRNAMRVNSGISASIDSEFIIVGDWPKRVRVQNISETGACINSETSLGLLGNDVLIDFDLKVGGLIRKMHLRALIRNSEYRSQDYGESSFVSGLQFIGMQEEERLSLANYAYENQLTKA